MRIVSWNIIPYFFRKLRKMLQKLLSAAVMIGTLRVKIKNITYFLGAVTSEGDTVLSNNKPFCITHAWDTWNELLLQYYEKCIKFRILFSFCFQIKCWLLGLEFTKHMSDYQTGKTLIRLLLKKKQSDLSLLCLSRPFWMATSVQNFRMFTELYNKKKWVCLFCLFDLILYVPSTIFQLNRVFLGWTSTKLG